MQLFVIYNNETEVLIKEVNILKETNKQYGISCEGVPRKILTKSTLNTYLNGYMFGFDKEEILKLWNEYHDNKIKEIEEELAFNKSLLRKNKQASTLVVQ